MFFVRGLDIWCAEWLDTGWADPKPLSSTINTPSNEQSPSLTPDGQKLFYVGFSRPGWPNAWDIWMSTWDSNLNDWGTPVNLGCPVNTPGVEFSAKIGPDGKTLYFHSTRGTCDSLGQLEDLYSSVWDSVTGWSTPQILGVSTGNAEYYVSIQADGQWLYFDRGVSDGKSIFVAPWTGSGWGPAYDLRPQIGERAGTPFITPSGESLFFSTTLLNSFGERDIFVMRLAPSGVEDEIGQNSPRNFELFQNYPNPFNGTTKIPFSVSSSAKESVELSIYNLLGQPVRTLLHAAKVSGKREIAWDGRNDDGKEVGSGIYFYKLKVGDEVAVRKAVLIK